MEILFIGLMLGSDLRKRYLVTEVPNMWEVSMVGSHMWMSLYGNAGQNHYIKTANRSIENVAQLSYL
jgi:hypothetical protein